MRWLDVASEAIRFGERRCLELAAERDQLRAKLTNPSQP